ncbi:MAG: PTS sugar transporter subunit IIB [Erysipelotrichaceae bacterium]|jgi:PTS system ascorbate-specific IIB component|nr:PTS sugar transporter subunit IIB [Erysipelotrichaceae bacterium]
MIKILCACASGSGSSLMMEMACKKALKSLGVADGEMQVQHCPLGEAKGQYKNYDALLVGKNFSESPDFVKIAQNGYPVLGVRNMLSPVEIAQAIKDAGLIQ